MLARWIALVTWALLGVGCKCASPSPSRVSVFDVHQHVSPGAMKHARELNLAHGITRIVQLSGGWPGAGLEESLAEAKSVSHDGFEVVVFANPPFGHLEPAMLVEGLVEAKRLGARGVKIFKSFGLSSRGPDGALLAVDDPAFDAFFEKCGELGLPVSIHVGDPVAFWLPVNEQNERVDELTVHPGWSNYGKPLPTWEALFQAYERRVARHPKTTFIGVHFGNAPEDPQRVAAMLEKYPNLFVDTGARVPELGRRDVREIFLKYQDRIFFGTDLGVGTREFDLMLGSRGASAPNAADTERFFDSTWKFFESGEEAIPSPTPIQGRWSIDGISLPREVLEKLYRGNAERLLK